MVTEKEIARINELYHKSKTEAGLTDEEKAEQQALRRKYIDSVKENLGVYLKDIKEFDEKQKEETAETFEEGAEDADSAEDEEDTKES